MGRCIELENRTADFALRIVKLCRSLPRNSEAQVIAKQLLRAGTSVGANYRATQRSRSKAEFISKLSVVLEEADEVLFWLELLMRAEILSAARLVPLMKEAEELISIFVASQKTVRCSPSIQQS
jgi:four helix bundle protein